MEKLAIKTAKISAAYVIKYIFNKIKDTSSKKVEEIKYKNITLDEKTFGNNLLLEFEKMIKSKDNYKNDEIFKNFEQNRIKSIINEIFEKEKIYENLKNKINEELKDFQTDNNDKNTLNILLMGEEKNIMIFIDTINIVYNSIENNENKNIINIEFKENLSKIKKVNLIEYNKEIANEYSNDKNKINCIWNFIDKENSDSNSKIEIDSNLYNNSPIIYIHFKDKIQPDKVEIISNIKNSLQDFIKNNIKYFNVHIIDLNKVISELSKDNTNNICNINLQEIFLNLEKSIINILMSKNEFNIEKKSKEISDIILRKINFESGNKINKIISLNNSLIQRIFKIFLFQNNLPPSVKDGILRILNNYQKYIGNRKDFYFSRILIKTCNDLILELRKSINKRSTELYEINNDLNKNEEKEELMLLNKIDSDMILFINQLNEDKKKYNKTEIKSSYEDDLTKKLEIIFDDYLLNKASIFINESVINCIKELIIEYYDIQIINYFYIKNKNEFILKYEPKNEEKKD